MLDVYEKRIVSRFANAKWDHVKHVVLNAADACVLVTVLNLPKHLRDPEEVIERDLKHQENVLAQKVQNLQQD